MVRTPLLGHRRRLYSSVKPPQKNCKIIQVVIVTTFLSISFLAILLQRSHCFSPLEEEDENELNVEDENNHLQIIGGTNATDDTEFPFALKLFTNGVFTCGAVIIDETIGLTAAHCMRADPNPGGYTVRAGKIKDPDIGPDGQEVVVEDEELRKVAKFIIHPKNDPMTADYDVAIFKVDPPFQFNSRVGKIMLPVSSTQFSEKDLIGKQFTAIGWGVTARFPPVDVLQKVTIPFVPRDTCQDGMGPSAERAVTQTMICAGVPGTYKSSCHGDSGSPLILPEGLPNRNVKGPLLIGLTSWGRFCGIESSVVYANVQFLSTWIHEQATLLLTNGTITTTTTSTPEPTTTTSPDLPNAPSQNGTTITEEPKGPTKVTLSPGGGHGDETTTTLPPPPPTKWPKRKGLCALFRWW